MVQFCPKCGTKAPDDESAFCNKCGTRLPPVIPEKKDTVCPRCGSKIPDEQSVFCNKCGSPLHTIPAVQVQPTGARPAAAQTVMKKECCPSCGAPLVDEISDFCNICGANIRGPAPLTPARETTRPSPEKTGTAPLSPARETTPPSPEKTEPGTPFAGIPDDGKDVPLQKKRRRPLLKWGLVAVVAVSVLIVIAAFIPGMISGTSQSSATIPAPTMDDQNPITALQTQETTQPMAPVPTTVPVEETPTLVPTMVVTTKASTTIATNASTTVATNTSTTVKPNVSTTISSQPYSIGQSATDGKAKVTVNGFTFKDKLSDPIPSYAIGKKYLIVDITYENVQQNATADANTSGMLVTDGGGYIFEPASDSVLENPFNGKSVLPQENRTGNMVYIVPPQATFLKLQYNFGNQSIAKFQLS